jgi:hypothetical protein
MLKSTSSSRRAVLAGAITMPIAAAVAVPALAEADDAELLRLGVKLEDLEREWLASTIVELKEDAVHEAAAKRAGVPWRPITSVPSDDRDEYYRRRAEATHDLNDRMFDLIDEIQIHKAKTFAGLKVLARACVLSNASQWVGEDVYDNHVGADRDRLFIEAASGVLGITPIMKIALAAVDVA